MGCCMSLQTVGISTQKDTYCNEHYNCNVYSHQGYHRKEMQDTYTVCLTIPNHSEYSLFAIFDGFNGDFASSYLSENILDIVNKLPNLDNDKLIIDAINNMDKQWLTQNERNNSGSTLVFAIIKPIYMKQSNNINSNLKQSSNMSFNNISNCKSLPKLQSCPSLSYQVSSHTSEIPTPNKIDKDFLSRNINKSIEIGYQSLPTNLSSDENCKHDFDVRIFWAGDSRALAIFKEYDFESLTVDHNCNLETETKRIVNANGQIKNSRIDGIIAVSRGFGCHLMKQNKSLSHNKQKMISTAECTHITCKQNETLLIFCDGLIAPNWDNETIVRNYKHILKEHEIEKHHNLKCLMYLIEQAMDEGSTDNITAMSIKLK